MEKFTSQDINEAFQSLSDYVQRYQIKHLEVELENVQKRLTMDYKIAIVANMSTGKSTFINALFGEEILPAFNHATTDCATFIYSTNDRRALIYFNNGKQFPLSYKDHQTFVRELMQYGQKDEDCNDDRHKNVERIDLYYPFKSIYTQNAGEMQIIFIDTPGPNATVASGEKHKDQTRRVLNDVDLALFLFDYGQLDANLDNDKQGLWHTIKERHDKDEDFIVYFVLNKIDMAFDDNATSKSDWFYHEQRAIDKLKEAAIKHGISDAKIFPISSYYALLRYKENKNEYEEDKLEPFEKKFKRKFDDEWENELIAYLGIEAFTKAINAHIAHKPQKRWEELATKMNGIIAQECKRLEGELELLQIPDKHSVQERLDNAENFIQRESQEIRQGLERELDRIVRFYCDKIQSTVQNRIQKDMLDPIEKIAKKAIAFAESFADGDSEKVAAKNADKRFDIVQIKGEIDLELRGSRDFGTVQAKMQDFIQEQLYDCKLNYTNIHSDIKNLYQAMEKEKYQCETEAKNQLEKGLDKQLELQKTSFKMQSIDIDAFLSFESTIPPSILDYHYEEAEYEEVSDSTWWNPFSWWDTKTVQTKAEQRIMFINGIELKETIENQVQENIETFQAQEIQSYKSSIEKIHEGAKRLFADFIAAKQEQIENLKAEIADVERQEERKKYKEEQLKFLHTKYTTKKEV